MHCIVSHMGGYGGKVRKSLRAQSEASHARDAHVERSHSWSWEPMQQWKSRPVDFVCLRHAQVLEIAFLPGPYLQGQPCIVRCGVGVSRSCFRLRLCRYPLCIHGFYVQSSPFFLRVTLGNLKLSLDNLLCINIIKASFR